VNPLPGTTVLPLNTGSRLVTWLDKVQGRGKEAGGMAPAMVIPEEQVVLEAVAVEIQAVLVMVAGIINSPELCDSSSWRRDPAATCFQQAGQVRL